MKNKWNRLWPIGPIQVPYFQAAVVVSRNAAINALKAARYLNDRGFLVQIFEAPFLASGVADAVAEAARNSGRFVLVASHSRIKALAKRIAQMGFEAPVISAGIYGHSAEQISEACLRNLD